MGDACAACGLDVYDGGELCPICRDDSPPGYTENGQNAGVERSTDESHTMLQRAARAAIKEHGGVTAAAHELDCNHGIIALARDGHDFPKARQVLGLPPKVVPVPPCPDCGQVHEQYHTCDDERERNRRKRHRLCFEFDTADELARIRAAVDAHPGGRSAWLVAAVEDSQA